MTLAEQILNLIHSRNYPQTAQFLREHTAQELLSIMSELLNIDEQKLAVLPMGGYGKGKSSGAYKATLCDMIKNIDRYDWVYEHLADDRSREVFSNLVLFRLIPDTQFLKAACDKEIPQYFDPAIISCAEDEVFVDCGGYIGDTAEAFIRSFGSYKSIHVYEPDQSNLEQCHTNLDQYSNIYIHNAGVGERNTALSFSENNGEASSFVAASDLSESVEIKALDQDISEPVTFIKMDVEGFEIPALLGAKKHIRKDRPKLAICTYHVVSDLWEIPMLIHSIAPNYQFYLRHYREDVAWETVLYAIPAEQAKKQLSPPGKRKRVVALPFDDRISNMQLTTDYGMVPYLLYKNHNCVASILSIPADNYTHLDGYLKGLKIEFMETGSEEEKLNYMIQHSKEIDLLLLRGAYPSFIPHVITYKHLNPQGKVYLATDPNSSWMDRIEWADPMFQKFMDCCDVIGASGRTIQKHLNEKWPWKVRYLPNGYYNFDNPGHAEMPAFSQKKNVILSVSRLGVAQKATDVLMLSFALIADRIPDWTLRLVGPVNKDFQPFIDEFFAQYPELRDRVVITGPIMDRVTLQQEFESAKVYAMPSRWEGGAPNVISQALTGGCAMAVTDFDDWRDCIDSGRCGVVSKVDDVQAFAQNLLLLCQHEQLENFCKNAYEHGVKDFDMIKIVDQIYNLLYGGEH